MKVLGTLMAAVLLVAFNASADSITLVCGGFAVPPGPASGTITCPGITGLGSLSAFDAEVLISTGFTGGAAGSNSTTAQYGSAVAGFTADTLTAFGAATSTGFSDTAGLALFPSSIDTFVDPITETQAQAVAGFLVSYLFNQESGSVSSSTGTVTVTYNYTPNPTSGVPEPASAELCAGGFLLLALVGRKALARK